MSHTAGCLNRTGNCDCDRRKTVRKPGPYFRFFGVDGVEYITLRGYYLPKSEDEWIEVP